MVLEDSRNNEKISNEQAVVTSSSLLGKSQNSSKGTLTRFPL
jgi:hypothetical protein